MKDAYAWISLVIGFIAASALGNTPGEGLTGIPLIFAWSVVVICAIIVFWRALLKEAYQHFQESKKVKYDENCVVPNFPGPHHSGLRRK